MAEKSLAERIAELRRQQNKAYSATLEQGQAAAQNYLNNNPSFTPSGNSTYNNVNLPQDAYEGLDTSNRSAIQAAYDNGDITSQYYEMLMATPSSNTPSTSDGGASSDKKWDYGGYGSIEEYHAAMEAARDAYYAQQKGDDTTTEPATEPAGGGGGYSGNSGGGGGSKAPAASDPLSTERNLIAPLANYDPAAYESYVAAMQALDAARGQAPTYNDTYGDQLSALYAEITGRDPFRYDLDSDPLYQQYRDQYMMQGQQAMMDAMGQAAALTGGYGSTYSQAVGQQQYNAYLQDLNQIVPDLYQNAYNRWLSEGDRLTQQYGILSDLSDRDYGMYRDQVSDYWTGVDYAQQQADLEYNRGLAEWERDYQLNEDARAQQAEDYDRLLQLMQIGYAPNADEIRAAGMSEAEAAAWQKYIKSQQSRGSGGSGGTPSSDAFQLSEAGQKAFDYLMNDMMTNDLTNPGVHATGGLDFGNRSYTAEQTQQHIEKSLEARGVSKEEREIITATIMEGYGRTPEELEQMWG